MIIDPKGNNIPFETDISLTIPPMQFDEDGELYLLEGETIYRLNKETGKTEVYLQYPEPVDSFTIGCGLILMILADKIVIYNMETKEWTEDETINDFLAEAGNQVFHNPTTGENAFSIFPFMDTEDVMYLACSRGLLRHVMEGSRVEQVIDGELTKFSDPSAAIVSVLALDNKEFIALFTDGKVFHYTYDPAIPSVPDKRLKVYSLKKDNLMQQAINMYHRNYPDVFVKYEIGITEGGVTREDALKKLNTEIMSGDGPDLLILDDMPIRSYLEKGVLEDLTPYLSGVDGGTEAGSLGEGMIPAVKKTFERDGKIMALPVQFTVPMIVGNRELIENVSELTSLADAAEAFRSGKTDQILRNDTENVFMQFLSLSSAHAWQKEDGSVDEMAVKEFLTQAKRLYELDSRTGIDSRSLYGFGEKGRQSLVESDVSEMLLENSQISFCNIFTSWELAMISSYMETDSDKTMIAAMPGTSESVFLPLSIVGINAASTNKELAGELFRILISKEIMRYADSGFPVHKEEYEKRFMEHHQGAATFSGDKDEYVLYINTLKKDWITHFQGIVESAETPDLTDKMVKEVIFEEGVDALNGSKTIDETVAAIMNRISIYVAE